MNNDLLKYLSSKIQEEQEVHFNELGLGTAKDYGDYRYVCGIIRGLIVANNILIETSERITSDEEDFN